MVIGGMFHHFHLEFIVEVGFRVNDLAGQEDVGCGENFIHGKLVILICVCQFHQCNGFKMRMPRIARIYISLSYHTNLVIFLLKWVSKMLKFYQDFPLINFSVLVSVDVEVKFIFPLG